LNISSIKMNLSYASASASTGSLPAIHKQTDANILHTILSAIGDTLANLDNAEISLNALELQHPFCTREVLGQKISRHYYMQAIRGLYSMVGAADFLGSPVSLINNLGNGFFDFFYEPVQGLLISPQGFGSGLARGTTSLVKRSVFGIFNTASKISGSLGKGVATLSMDDSYIRQREMSGREKATYVGEGIALGARDLGTSVYKGLTGVMREPLIGAQEGVGGFMKGVGKGFLGAAVKPIVGLFDFTRRTTQAISHTARMFESNTNLRFRPPRYFGPDKILQPYSTEKSYGQTLLYHLESGKFKSEWYLFHFIIGKKILLVSNKQVMLITSNFSRKWSHLLINIKKVEKVEDGLEIHLSNQLVSGNKFEIIYIPNSQLLKKVHSNLTEAIQSEKMKLDNRLSGK